MRSILSKRLCRANDALTRPRFERKDRHARRVQLMGCAAYGEGHGAECVEWDLSTDSLRRDATNHSDMQAGFSGRVDELHDLHLDLIDNRFNCSLATAPSPETLAPGIEIQNVAPWRHIHQSVNLLKAKSIWGEINEVYVFLFGGAKPGCTGIYSLRTFTDENIPKETVIAFECLEDAVRYAGLLAATMSHTPTVHGITPEQLAEFCMDAGYSCQLEAAGSSLAPPGYNVRVTDWERASRLRAGDFSVLPSEPLEDAALDGSLRTDVLACPDVAADGSAVAADEADDAAFAAPGMLESLTPFLTEQVARYYNSPDLWGAYPSSGDEVRACGGEQPQSDLESMRQQLERLW